MAGVVVVAVAVIAVPSLALGSSGTPIKQAPGATSVQCPLVGASGGSRKPDSKAESRHHRRHHRHHGHGKPLPRHGATGATGTTSGCPPPCVAHDAHRLGATGRPLLCPPLPCPAATGSTGLSRAASPALLCRPLPCLYRPQGSTGATSATGGVICPCWRPVATGSTGVTAGPISMICRPLPCPLASTVTRVKLRLGKKTTEIIACARIPVCPLGAGAGTSTSTSIATVCSPCPPEPVARGVKAVLHACPEAAGGHSVSGSAGAASGSSVTPTVSNSAAAATSRSPRAS
jgi:hypothetical protein